MSSDQDFYSDFLEKLSSFILVDKDVNSNLQEITHFIETEFLSPHFSAVLKLLFNDALKQIDVSLLEEKFLKDVLLATQKIFSDDLSNILFKLETASQENFNDEVQSYINEHLQVNLNILEGYKLLLEELLYINGIEAIKLQCVPKTLLTTLYEAFTHCCDSETTYGIFFTESSNLLSSLFRKSFEVQILLLKLVEDKLSFNCSLEQDLSLLVSILEKVGIIGNIVVKLELKATVDQWKVFAKLATKYAYHLKPRLDLVTPISSLTNTLQKIIILVTTGEISVDETSQIRYLKLGNFILKVVIKLSELYADYLGDCHTFILQLLIILHGSEHLVSEDLDLGPKFRSYLSIGALPLLSYILPDKLFIQELDKVCKNLPSLTADAKVGLYALSVNIIRKLVKSERDVQQLWIGHNLILKIIEIVKHCSAHLKTPIAFDNMEGYSNLVSGLSILMVSQLNCEEFQIMERTLFTQFFQGNFFSTVFLEDFICIIARLTNESVVLKWIQWLKSFKNIGAPQIVYVISLERRLTCYLSEKNRNSVATPTNILFLPPLNPTISDFLNLTNQLKLIGSEEIFSEKVQERNKQIEEICLMWECSLKLKPSFTTKEIAVKGISWWTEFINALCLATSGLLSYFNNQQIVEILRIMLTIICSSDSLCKISVLKVITSFAKNRNSNPVQNDVNNLVSDLLNSLLQDEDPIIVNFTLETMQLLTSSVHKCVLQNILSQNQTLEKGLNGCYIKRFNNMKDEGTFNYHNEEFIHKCAPFTSTKSFQEENDHLPPQKKVKVSEQFDDLVMHGIDISKKINYILSDNKASDHQKMSLSKLLKEYDLLKQFL